MESVCPGHGPGSLSTFKPPHTCCQIPVYATRRATPPSCQHSGFKSDPEICRSWQKIFRFDCLTSFRAIFIISCWKASVRSFVSRASPLNYNCQTYNNDAVVEVLDINCHKYHHDLRVYHLRVLMPNHEPRTVQRSKSWYICRRNEWCRRDHRGYWRWYFILTTSDWASAWFDISQMFVVI